VDKSVLRSTLKKLRALPLDGTGPANIMMAPQEMLDFLAIRAGIKPVHLLGRGFDDAKWIEGVLAMARKRVCTLFKARCGMQSPATGRFLLGSTII
jgi:hypothetical protein